MSRLPIPRYSRRSVIGFLVTTGVLTPLVQACAPSATPAPTQAPPKQTDSKPVAETPKPVEAPRPAAAQPTQAPKPTEAPKPQSEPAKPAAQPGAQVTLTLWTHDDLMVKHFKKWADRWAQEKQPGKSFKFDFLQVPDHHTKILNTLVAGSGAPDIPLMEISQFPRFLKGGVAEAALRDLTDLAKPVRDKFVKWDPYEYKGKIYAIECTLLGPVAWFYRQDVMDAEGIKTPIETYDDWMNAGVKLSQKGMWIDVYNQSIPGKWLVLTRQFGGDMFDRNGNVTVDTPEMTKSLEFVIDGILKRKHTWFTQDTIFSAPVATAFNEGKLVGAIGADWYLSFFMKRQATKHEGKFRMQYLPAWQVGGNHGSTWGGNGSGVSVQSKNPDLAKDIIAYAILAKEPQVQRFLDSNYFPTMLEAMQDPRVKDATDPYLGGVKPGALYLSLAEKGLGWQINNPFYAEASTVLAKTVGEAAEGKRTVSDALKAAATEIKEIVRKGA